MPDMTAEQFQAAQEKEYGTYVATELIRLGGVPAFNVGDPVPVSHVENNVVDKDSVAKVTTKAADKAKAAASEGNV